MCGDNWYMHKCMDITSSFEYGDLTVQRVFI